LSLLLLKRIVIATKIKAEVPDQSMLRISKKKLSWAVSPESLEVRHKA
jgi:hypothetical protein